MWLNFDPLERSDDTHMVFQDKEIICLGQVTFSCIQQELPTSPILPSSSRHPPVILLTLRTLISKLSKLTTDPMEMDLNDKN